MQQRRHFKQTDRLASLAKDTRAENSSEVLGKAEAEAGSVKRNGPGPGGVLRPLRSIVSWRQASPVAAANPKRESLAKFKIDFRAVVYPPGFCSLVDRRRGLLQLTYGHCLTRLY